MTPEQRKRVAEVLSGEQYIVYGCDVVSVVFADGHPPIPGEVFRPAFEGSPEYRSQALAVVKYLFGLSYSTVLAHLSTIRTAIQDGDIESLLSLVLELSDE